MTFDFPFDGEFLVCWGKKGEGLCKRNSTAPDEDTFRYLALAYANNHRIMHQRIRCMGYTHAHGDYSVNNSIINGTIKRSFRGKIFGSMDDYNYLVSNCLEVSFSISCCKHPPVSHLPRYWLDNKNALLTFMETTHMGVKGLVKDIRGW